MQLLLLRISICVLHTDYYNQSAVKAQGLGYTRHIYRVPLSIQTYDSVIMYMAWF